jgi:hypothetical protein
MVSTDEIGGLDPITWEAGESEDGAKGEEFVARWRGMSAIIGSDGSGQWGAHVERDDGGRKVFSSGDQDLQVECDYLPLSYLGAKTLCEMAMWAESAGWKAKAPGVRGIVDAATSPAALAGRLDDLTGQVDSIARATTEALLAHARRLERLEAAMPDGPMERRPR